MGDIKISLMCSDEPDKSIGLALIDFYEQMKKVESDPQRGALQAILIVMAVADLNRIFEKSVRDHE